MSDKVQSGQVTLGEVTSAKIQPAQVARMQIIVPDQIPSALAAQAPAQTKALPQNNVEGKQGKDSDAISKQWAAIRRKQQELSRKEEELRALEATLADKLNREQKLQENIRKMLDEADVLKDKKIKHLIDVYANMKAKKAALVLETLEEDVAVKILSGMRGRKAGEILSFVTPKKAARLSERLTDLRVPFAE